MLLPLAILAAGYMVFVFPFAYFRHDDWVGVGNSALLPADWGALWRPTLKYATGDETWFFRPFFKLDQLIFLKLFGFHYWAWLTGTLVMTLGAAWLAADIIRRVTGDRRRAVFFLWLFAACPTLHFGSLMWAGEGLMNCPQILFLMASLWLFCRGLSLRGTRRGLVQASGVALFTLSLGFKESGVFHVALIFAMLFSGPMFRAVSLRRRVAAFLPYAVVSGIYLVFRLVYLPINPGYLPQYTVDNVARPLAVIAACFLPAAGALWYAAGDSFKNVVREKWLYAPFLALLVLPYLGHPFFSPGWLLGSGFFFLFTLSLGGARFPESFRRARYALTPLFLVSVLVIGMRLHRFGWWAWKAPEVAMHNLVTGLPTDKTSAIKVFDCTKDGDRMFDRVVGFESSLWFMWRLHHSTTIPAIIYNCEMIGHDPAPNPDNELRVKWVYPTLSVLHVPE